MNNCIHLNSRVKNEYLPGTEPGLRPYSQCVLIMKENIKLVHLVAKKYWKLHKSRIHTILEYEDLVSVGSYGLFLAARNYNSSFNISFSSYAFYHIRQKIIREIHNNSGMAHIPVYKQELIYRANKNPEFYSPAVHDEIKYLESRFLYSNTQSGYNANNETKYRSIDDFSTERSIVKTRSFYYETPEKIFLKKHLKKRLLYSIIKLEGSRNRRILFLLYGFDRNFSLRRLEDLGTAFNVSGRRISQVRDNYLKKVKELKLFDMNDYL